MVFLVFIGIFCERMGDFQSLGASKQANVCTPAIAFLYRHSPRPRSAFLAFAVRKILRYQHSHRSERVGPSDVATYFHSKRATIRETTGFIAN